MLCTCSSTYYYGSASVSAAGATVEVPLIELPLFRPGETSSVIHLGPGIVFRRDATLQRPALVAGCLHIGNDSLTGVSVRSGSSSLDQKFASCVVDRSLSSAISDAMHDRREDDQVVFSRQLALGWASSSQGNRGVICLGSDAATSMARASSLGLFHLDQPSTSYPRLFALVCIIGPAPGGLQRPASKPSGNI